MTDEPYADPELRAALSTLLDDEPAAPPVVDDVRRGRARRRRRRAGAGAIVALVTVTVAGVALGASVLDGRSSSPVAPAAGQAAPDAAPAMADRLGPVLATMGWSVVESGSAAGADGTEIRLTVARVEHPEVVSELWILGAVDDVRPVTHLARCTAASCPGEQVMTMADGFSATSGYEERGATSLTLDPPGAGARMLDRAFRTGSLIEVVSVPPRAAATASPGGSASLLTFEQLRRVITAIGDPLVSRAASPAPSVTGATGLRGDRVQEFTCPTARRYAPREDSPQPVTGEPLEMLLCGAVLDPGRKDPVLVTPAEGAALTDLVAALSQPDDLSRLKGCAMNMKAQPVVLVRTTDGAWMVRIPVDVCDQMFRSAGDAIDAARAVGVPGPSPG